MTYSRNETLQRLNMLLWTCAWTFFSHIQNWWYIIIFVFFLILLDGIHIRLQTVTSSNILSSIAMFSGAELDGKTSTSKWHYPISLLCPCLLRMLMLKMYTIEHLRWWSGHSTPIIEVQNASTVDFAGHSAHIKEVQNTSAVDFTSAAELIHFAGHSIPITKVQSTSTMGHLGGHNTSTR